MTSYRTIIWASDGSPGADAALPAAVDFAERTGAHLIAAHCDQRFTGRSGNWPVLPDEVDIVAQVRDQVADLRAREVDIEFVLRHSHQDAADVMAELAAEYDADLIVCGSRGLGAMGRVFLGSFTQRLLHVAPCAVLVVPERVAVVDGREAEKTQAPA